MSEVDKKLDKETWTFLQTTVWLVAHSDGMLHARGADLRWLAQTLAMERLRSRKATCSSRAHPSRSTSKLIASAAGPPQASPFGKSQTRCLL